VIPVDRKKRFLEIKQKYDEFYQTFYSKGKGAVFDTEKGIWGPSGTENVYGLFEKIKLGRFRNFLDIGSGDGKVVLLAALFGVNAVGVEFDKRLVEVGEKIKKELKLKANLICGDYFSHDFSKYDFIFINPDQGFHKGLEDKLLKEMRADARLFVYNNIFLPRFLKKGKTYWLNEIPVIGYRKNK
jgi:SAM-dependent methyltransferase